MKIRVKKDMTVRELTTVFRKIYPFLKIEVYYKGQEMHSDSFHTLGKLSSTKTPEDFELLPAMSIKQVEQLFWDKMGLQIAVFRKIGNTWLYTAFTNNLTLKRQNQLVESLGFSSSEQV